MYSRQLTIVAQVVRRQRWIRSDNDRKHTDRACLHDALPVELLEVCRTRRAAPGGGAIAEVHNGPSIILRHHVRHRRSFLGLKARNVHLEIYYSQINNLQYKKH